MRTEPSLSIARRWRPPAARFAHHSTAAEFDKEKPITFTGTVKKVQWMNPHIYTLVETKGADGKPVVYRIEGGRRTRLFARAGAWIR